MNKVVYQDTMQCPKLGWHRRRRLVVSEATEADTLLAQQGEEIEAAFIQHRYAGSEVEIEPSHLRQQAKVPFPTLAMAPLPLFTFTPSGHRSGYAGDRGTLRQRGPENHEGRSGDASNLHRGDALNPKPETRNSGTDGVGEVMQAM